MSQAFHFKRPKLAAHYADLLTGADAWSDAPNGLFLAAPRRTGKSRFLQEDLLPELETRELLVVYVDLWANKDQSPMALIAKNLALAVQRTQGFVARTAQAAGMDSINFLGVKIDVGKIGKTEGLTLHQVLGMIHEQTGQKIALIIDEAQHALTTEEGDVTMSALKSARDQMRKDGVANLLLVMSGSHRDKLMRLVNTSAAPFWGSEVQTLPTLGEPFVQALAQQLQREQPALLGLDVVALTAAFGLCGELPQFFIRCIQKAKLAPANTSATDFVNLVSEAAQQRQADDREAYAQMFTALADLEQAVLWRLFSQGNTFRAFDAAALAFYSAKIGKKISAAQTQKSLQALRDHNPSLIWKSLRGDYSLYDQDMADWYAYLVGQQAWPPN